MSWLDKILPSRIRATKDDKGSVQRDFGTSVVTVALYFILLNLIKIIMYVQNVIIMKGFLHANE
jgi:hypothetical protein